MATIGVILAAGYSTRTAVVKPGQKAAFKVRWNGEVKPMVVHQLDALQEFLDDVIVVVGYEAYKVAPLVLGRKGVHLFEDRMIKGLGWVWKQLAYSLEGFVSRGEWMLSVTSDDLHGVDDFRRVAANRSCAVSVKRLLEPRSRYTKYEVKKGRIVGISEKTGGIGWYGTGIWMLNFADIWRCRSPSVSQNFETEDIMRELIASGKNIRAIKVKKWHDAGNPEGLKEVLAE